ncbi:ABC transporter permease [Campylobacter sp. VicNov18]|uniref:methionine ABC transporter permease n=1 Tax=Campylobacter bilis TaxID=2691918 RepID=UPI00130DA5D9|nr:methionine ABC transporter permease [Campylobacter bilis]MPV63610.1 ABC transporter permease subunit [Campylobacter hepaticus]MBM0637110.1 ABC transporter permease subunit [Campylobacter bilis]MCC8277731.1 ABC transporter permease [Campylobacter bilis]MCC8299340.1 ABC transporter permease [Campylobacter bilis]MCC8300640.1 ABC transporter permease [Campylobacter bilis]
MSEENHSIFNAFYHRISQFFNDFSWEDIKEFSLNTITSFGKNYDNILKPALNETVYMSLMAVFFGFLLAIIPGILLAIWNKNGIKENKLAYGILDFITNILRAFPFLILMVVLLPLSKILVGTSIGTNAAIVPLAIGIAPYLAKMLEGAFKEIDQGIIEAAKSYGSTDIQIIFKVIFNEALPAIISGLTLTLIFTIGFSALAGAVGGGGLGDVAIRYGYERFNKEVMIQTVIILLVLVQIVQILGNLFYTWAKSNKILYIIATLLTLFTINIIININNEENFLGQIIVVVLLIMYFIYKILKK